MSRMNRVCRVNAAPGDQRPSQVYQSGLSQQALQLPDVQPMAADHRAIEEQHRHIEREPSLEDGIGIHIDCFDRRQRHFPAESPQLLEHLLAEVALAPVNYGENGGCFQCGGGAWANGPPGSGAIAAGAGGGSDVSLTESAMKRTVCGGTSPTAVTL
jgi:hypothetical protein